MQFTDFNQFCSFMESFMNLEKRTGTYSVRHYRLDRMHAILDHIGHPEKDFLSIHVTGSKGKGSTACFLAKGLETLGFKTGLYLSPHLHDYRERFTLAGSFFPEEQLVDAANELVDRLKGFSFSDELGQSDPTAFELFTTFSFMLFSLTKCQWAVIETGLGGRLDATNTIVPQASVITPIELEHTAILGHTINLIAIEKSKIIKSGIPVFISRQPEEARNVFAEEAAQKHSRLYDLVAEVERLHTHTERERQQCTIEWRSGEETFLSLSMLGEVQAENAALALIVLKSMDLYRAGATEKALEHARLPGRLDKISEVPPVYVDGAHTVQSLRHLVNTFNQMFPGGANTVIYGALLDKDHVHMSHLLLPYFNHIIISRPGTFKKSDPEALFLLFKEELSEYPNVRLYLEQDPVKALELAMKSVSAEGAILCTGSFYLAGDIVKAHEQLQRERGLAQAVAGCH
ncbi:MAG: folylpolyglutamate synthase/dihydrofolate synthase family protein [Sphaerochaetaceae bacterium]